MVEALSLVPGTPTSLPADAWIAPAEQANTIQHRASLTSQPAPEDTVTLSASSEAHLLQQRGNSVAQIAIDLHTTVDVVDGLLGFTPASATPATPIPAPTHLPFGPPNTLPLARAS